ncbi:MAG: hypothetical protein WDN04_18160 [Rhodospirillales bacterium]
MGQYTDYTTAAVRSLQGIAVANSHLYLFDGSNGVFVGSLANPRHPSFTGPALGYGIYQFQQSYVRKGRIYMTGRDFIDNSDFQIFGTATPSAPTLLGSASLDGYASFRIKVAPPYVVGFGASVSITDVSDPAHIVSRGSIASPVATNGFVVGNYAYGVGGVGMDIWNITDPDAPAAAGHATIDGLRYGCHNAPWNGRLAAYLYRSHIGRGRDECDEAARGQHRARRGRRCR